MKKYLLIFTAIFFVTIQAQTIETSLNMKTNADLVGGSLILDNEASMSINFQMPGLITSGAELTAESVAGAATPDELFIKNVFAGLINETDDIQVVATFFSGKNRIYGDGSAFTLPLTDKNIRFHYDPTIIDSTVVSYADMFSQDGTGLDFSLILKKSLLVDASIYQDARLGTGIYTTDLQIAWLIGPFALETNFGASFPQGTTGSYHGGIFMNFEAGENASLLMKMSIPIYTPPAAFPGLKQLNILIEPRANFGIVDLYLALFFHPDMYNFVPMTDEGKIDINLGIGIGDEEKDVVSAGFDTTMILDMAGTDKISAYMVPYAQLIVEDAARFKIYWKAKLWPFAADDLVSFALTLDTEFTK